MPVVSLSLVLVLTSAKLAYGSSRQALAAKLTDDVSWEVFYATGQSDLTFQQGGNGTRTRLTQSVRSTSTTSCLDASGGCVPINLWGPLGQHHS